MLTLVQQLRQYHNAAAKLAIENGNETDRRTSAWRRRKEQEQSKSKDAPRKESKAALLRRKIVATLSEYTDGLRRVDLGKRLGCEPKSLAPHLDILERRGLIQQEEPYGPWRVVGAD